MIYTEFMEGGKPAVFLFPYPLFEKTLFLLLSQPFLPFSPTFLAFTHIDVWSIRMKGTSAEKNLQILTSRPLVYYPTEGNSEF